MSYKITGASPDPDGVVSISTTAESAEEAARIAQEWSECGVRNTAITDGDGRWDSCEARAEALTARGKALRQNESAVAKIWVGDRDLLQPLPVLQTAFAPAP